MAAAFTCTGEETVAFSAGEQTFMPLPEGAEHDVEVWLTTTMLSGLVMEYEEFWVTEVEVTVKT